MKTDIKKFFLKKQQDGTFKIFSQERTDHPLWIKTVKGSEVDARQEMGRINLEEMAKKIVMNAQLSPYSGYGSEYFKKLVVKHPVTLENCLDAQSVEPEFSYEHLKVFSKL